MYVKTTLTMSQGFVVETNDKEWNEKTATVPMLVMKNQAVEYTPSQLQKMIPSQQSTNETTQPI
jgi:hypothetical protein